MDDSNLIFLVSQPRSGSTLLQRIVGTHREVFTTSEPWLMMGFLYGLKPGGVYAEYHKATEYAALNRFLAGLPGGGRSRYLAGLRDFSLSLYAAYAESAGRKYFLDKTPRYYFVLDELLEVFPSARFIFLRRHPISVLYSIVRTWTRDSWYSLSNYRHDLMDGLEAAEKYIDHARIYHITYEGLVQHPQKEIRGLCDYLGIDYSEDMLAYDHKEHWLHGDQSEQLQSGKVNPGRLHLWENELMNDQLWRVLSDYLEWIGPQRMNRLGYSFPQAQAALAANCPSGDVSVAHERTFSLSSLLDNTKDCMYSEQQLNARINILLEAVESIRKNADDAREELNKWKASGRIINYRLMAERIKRRVLKFVD